jgi:hypothetical protein
MKPGTCHLCLTEAELQQSHYLGRALYKLSKEDGKLPVFASTNLVIQHQKQIKDYLLCWSCEQRFATIGEDYVMRMVNRKEGFKMMDLIRANPARRTKGEYSVYLAADIGIDTDRLAYFALSTIWRGGVHVWSTFEGRATGGLQLGDNQERLRQYLIGIAPYPKQVALKISVARDNDSQNSVMFPYINLDQHDATVFTFMARGIWFDVAVGDSLPSYVYGSCCVRSPEKPIFVGDFSEFLTYDFEKFKQTARIFA